MVVAHLVEWLLTIREVRSSNPVIGKNLLNIYCQLLWKDENKEKEAGNGPFLIKVLDYWILTRVFCYRKRPLSQMCHNDSIQGKQIWQEFDSMQWRLPFQKWK